MGGTLTMPGPPPARLGRLLTPQRRGAESQLPQAHPGAAPTAGPGSLFPGRHPGPRSPRSLTQTLVGSLRCAPRPRAVLEEGQAALTVRARGVVLAPADQPALRVGATLAGVSITLAPGKERGGRGLRTQRATAWGSPTGSAEAGLITKPALRWAHCYGCDEFY